MPLCLNSWSSFSSRAKLVPRRPFTTSHAQKKYSWTRSAVQPANTQQPEKSQTEQPVKYGVCSFSMYRQSSFKYGKASGQSSIPNRIYYYCTFFGYWPTGVQRFRSLRLYNLSASLTSLAWWLQWGACATCWRFLSCLGRLLSSVTSWTIRATTGPNLASSSAAEVSVSSIVSWSKAAWKTDTGIREGWMKRGTMVPNYTCWHHPDEDVLAKPGCQWRLLPDWEFLQLLQSEHKHTLQNYYTGKRC